MDIDGLVAPAEGLVPYFGQQLALGHDPPRTRRQEEQQIELLLAQIQLTIPQDRQPGGRVHPQRSNPDRRLVNLAAGPAQHGPQPGLQLPHRKGLHDIVICAGVEGADDLVVLVAGRDDDNRDGADSTQHPQQIETIDVGKAQIQQDHVGPAVHDQGQTLASTAGGVHHIAALAQRTRQGSPDAGVVFDNHHRGHYLEHPRGRLTWALAGSTTERSPGQPRCGRYQLSKW